MSEPLKASMLVAFSCCNLDVISLLGTAICRYSAPFALSTCVDLAHSDVAASAIYYSKRPARVVPFKPKLNVCCTASHDGETDDLSRLRFL